jgi:hypothetical protein
MRSVQRMRGMEGNGITLNKLKKPRATPSMAPPFYNLLSSSFPSPLYTPPRRFLCTLQLQLIMNIMEYFDEDSGQEGNRTPPLLSPSLLPQDEVPEVSMVEQEDVTGVTFTPEYVVIRA